MPNKILALLSPKNHYAQWRINPPRAGGKEYFWAGHNLRAVFGGSYLACLNYHAEASYFRYFRDSMAIDKNVQYTLHRSSIA